MNLVSKNIKKIRDFKPKISQEALRDKAKKLERDVRKNISTAIGRAFAFLIALAWKDMIVDIVNKIVGLLNMEENLYLFRIVTALLVTIICVIGIWVSSKIAAKEEQK